MNKENTMTLLLRDTGPYALHVAPYCPPVDGGFFFLREFAFSTSFFKNAIPVLIGIQTSIFTACLLALLI